MLYIISFLLSFVFSAIITPLIIKLAKNLKIIDEPKEPRKLHGKPTPLLGGLAIFLSLAISIGIFLYTGKILDSSITMSSILAILFGGAILQIGGAIDDVFDLKPEIQILFPCLAAIVAMYFGIRVDFITNPFGGVIGIAYWLSIAITFLWLLGIMYTTKFLDGLDGLVAGQALIGSIIIFVVSLFWDISQSGTSYISLMVAGVCLGFLLYNFYPAKIFLGEGGSVFLGFMLGILSIISGSKIATAMLIMGLPIIDTIWVIAKRIQSGKSPFVGDRTHFHFKLLERGLNQKQAVIFMYGITIIFGAISLFLGTKGKIFAIIFLVAFSIIVLNKLYIKKTYE